MQNDLFFICACAETDDAGIVLCKMDSATSTPVRKAVTRLPGTNFLCFSPDHAVLYATANTKANGGSIAAYRCGNDGSLHLLNQKPSNGLAACYVTCAPDARFLYAVNYSSGNIAEYPLAPDGSLAGDARMIQHDGPCGPVADRQDKPHTHCAVFTPDHQYLCVNDLGIDSIMIYKYGANGLELPAAAWKAEPGEGPRHILFDKSGKTAYVMNELGNSVTAMAYEHGSFRRITAYTSLPSDCKVKTKAAAIRFSPDEKFLYATNRGFDSIACYRILSPGKLELFDIVSSYGSSPRDFNFLPGGKMAAAANEFSDVVTFYDFDAGTGKLTYRENADMSNMPRPLYISF